MVCRAGENSLVRRDLRKYEYIIDDQIDIILVGSIQSATYQFYEDEDPNLEYWSVREKFYRSKKILKIAGFYD